MMLKKFKILVIIIVLSLLGLVMVISIWLYGSYNNRLEAVSSDVERGLFNTIQKYYDTHEEDILQNEKGDSHGFVEAGLVSRLIKAYPSVDSLAVSQLIDDYLRERFVLNHEKRNKGDDNRSLAPPFLLQQIVFDKQALTEIDSLLEQSLYDKGIRFDIDVVHEQFSTWPKGKGPRVFVDSLGMISTRPVLVNPANKAFLKAKFEQPVFYIFTKMFWQIVVALLLIAGLVGTFLYLIWTINRQNKMALVRKSFVNNMTHELKTPVATVMAAVEAIQRYGAKDDKVKMKRYLQISQRELGHLAGMVEKVLQLDIDEVNGIHLDYTSFDLVPFIQEIISLSELSAKKPVQFTFKYQSDALIIHADASHLKNVFSNLIDNAMKYSGDQVRIDINIEKKNNQVIIEMADNGIGISNQYQKDIFQMFFRVPNGDIHQVKGFGLGLAYVKQVIEQHNGTIGLNSKIHSGTTFVIALPQ